MFGVGLGNDEFRNIIISEHNQVIYLLRRIGLIGTLLVAIIIFAMFFHVYNYKKKIPVCFAWIGIAVYVALTQIIQITNHQSVLILLAILMVAETQNNNIVAIEDNCDTIEP